MPLLRGRRRREIALLVVALLGAQLPFGQAHATTTRGTLAVVNIGPFEGTAGLVDQLADMLAAHESSSVREPGVRAYLAGHPATSGLPVGARRQALIPLVERLRSSRGGTDEDLAALGQALEVDYLLLVRVRAPGYAARLYSVRLRSYAPGQLEANRTELSRVRDYVREQTARPVAAKRSYRAWWIWAAAAVLTGVTLGVALGTQDKTSGKLRIEAER